MNFHHDPELILFLPIAYFFVACAGLLAGGAVIDNLAGGLAGRLRWWIDGLGCCGGAVAACVLYTLVIA